jgi:Na+-transporting NADH:ubiquinone oxidoreductase subunit F
MLSLLDTAGIHVPSACGGAGTCGLCKLRVMTGGLAPTPQEKALLSRLETRRGVRLACQLPVIGAMKVEVDDACFGVNNWRCSVQSTHNVTSLIREIVLCLPEGEKMKFRPGSFIQVACPPYQLDFSTLDIGQAYHHTWDKFSLWSLKAGTDLPVTRAYSIANRPDYGDIICLNIRIALPPPGKINIPPGLVSSWLFSLKPGDFVDTTGPYGHFFVEQSDREAIFIGGGVGMAPLYAQILDLLERQQTRRRISFWYGARNRQELYYEDVFDKLQAGHENFSWHVVLSEPVEQDHWEGLTGLVHTAIYEQHLAHHREPEQCEYYLCGPPLMVRAVRAMLDNLGVDTENIHYDDFGG